MTNLIQLPNKKKRAYLLIILIILCLIGACFLFSSSYKVSDRTKKLKTFKSVDKKNAIGWLRVQGTNIDMPILYYYDNDVEDPTYNVSWSFENYKKQPEKIVIYSHNVKNVSSHPLINDPTHQRFEPLMGFVYKSFIDKNKYIQYTVNNKNYLYKIYGVSFQEKDSFDGYQGNVSKKYKRNYIKQVKNNSYFDMNVDVDDNDKLLTLVTCTRFFGADESYSFVVDAREVRKNEKVKNYNVKEKKNYKKIKNILEGDVKNE